MPLKFSFRKVPIDAEGRAYDSLASFQAASLGIIHAGITGDLAKAIVDKKAEVIEILELSESSRPSARGVPKKRRAKQNLQGELPNAA